MSYIYNAVNVGTIPTNFIIHDKPRHTGESPVFTSVSDVDCGDLGVYLTFFNMQSTKKTTISYKIPQVIQPGKTCKCGACEPSMPKLPDGMRRLKVGNKWKQNGTGHEPSITLQGEWLRNAGFEYGSEILLTVKQNQLIVNLQKR